MGRIDFKCLHPLFYELEKPDAMLIKEEQLEDEGELDEAF